MTERFSKAVAYASRLHREQRRKGNGCPYLAHLLGVASLVMEAGGDEDECIAALLHDAVEDQGGGRTAARIRERFGQRVIEIVLACSEEKSAGLAWLGRKRAFIRKVAGVGPSARLVLAADKLHNARSLAADLRAHGPGIWNHFRGGREGSLWYYRAMAEAIQQAGGSPLDADLAAAVRSLEAAADGDGASDPCLVRVPPEPDSGNRK